MKSHLHRILSAVAGLALVATLGFSVTSRAEDSNAASTVENIQCVGNICEGDIVQIYTGGYAGYRGRVVGVDGYNYSATVQLDIGGYITLDARALNVLSRPYPSPTPYPHQFCPPGYIYDVYRGCVRVVRRVPSPYPQQPRPYPNPYPPTRGGNQYPGPSRQPGQGGNPYPSPSRQPGTGGYPGGYPGGGYGHGHGRRG